MKKFSGFLALLFLTLAYTQAQEILIPLQTQPELVKYVQLHPSTKSVQANSDDTLKLPFFDDFSSYTLYPADTLWADNHAFVNTVYGVNPPSIGVATLDAIQFNGTLYDDASANGFLADRLTSKPIDLSNLTLSDSLYLSFYYQPMGNGDAPETEDSLYLEIYSPDADNWYWLWGAKGSALQDFNRVQLLVPDSTSDGFSFYEKGFQFRFSNYASLTPIAYASFAGNVDHWHLDYLYLDTGRTATDTLLTDLSFLSPPGRLLLDYTAMPYLHYYINASQLQTQYALNFANHRDNSMIVDFSLQVIDVLQSTDTLDLIPGGQASDNFPPGDTLYVNNYSGNPFFSGDEDLDEARFKVQSVIKPGEAVADFTANNDTAYYYQHFHNYYAYDDGSAESGYGLYGEGTQNALLAYRFRNYYASDSLRAIQMYFNRTLGDANDEYFFVMVWDHNPTTQQPGNLLFSQIGLRPQFGDSLHQFKTYRFQNSFGVDTAIQVPDTFYVGWKQTSTQLLNVGFDKNSIRKPDDGSNWFNPNIYYNISGSWVPSSFEGALMIRPVFNFEGPLLSQPSVPEPAEIKLYPNPARDYVWIETNAAKPIPLQVRIFDATGRCLWQDQMHETISPVSVQFLPTGLYWIQVQGDDFAKSEKIFIQR